MTYYQFTLNRHGKTLPFDKKTCAALHDPLLDGELFITRQDGTVEVYKAYKCTLCGTLLVEHYFSSEDDKVDNAHFLPTVNT